MHGGSRVAMRQGDAVHYLHGDHLGSTSLTTDAVGAVVHEARYLPFGEPRWQSGQGVTDFGFTSQRNEAGFGLMDYNARMYSPRLGRFVSPDSIVPDFANPQSLNRLSYVRNNPIAFTDPSGHFTEDDIPFLCGSCETWEDVEAHFDTEAFNLLKAGEVSFGSIIFGGTGSEVTNKYVFILKGYYNGQRDLFRMAVWDLNNQNEVNLSDVLAHDRITVWSTNTEVDEGGYFYTNWDKGFLDEGEAEAWASPQEKGFGDLTITPKEAYTRYRVFTDWNGWFPITWAGTLLSGKPTTPNAYISLAIDLSDKGISMKNRSYIDRVYPLVYTGNAWTGEGSSTYTKIMNLWD